MKSPIDRNADRIDYPSLEEMGAPTIVESLMDDGFTEAQAKWLNERQCQPSLSGYYYEGKFLSKDQLIKIMSEVIVSDCCGDDYEMIDGFPVCNNCKKQCSPIPEYDYFGVRDDEDIQHDNNG